MSLRWNRIATFPNFDGSSSIAAENGRNVAWKLETSRMAMLPTAATARPPRIERLRPKRGASRVASMPAANTTMTVPAKNRPSWIGVNCSPLEFGAHVGLHPLGAKQITKSGSEFLA